MRRSLALIFMCAFFNGQIKAQNKMHITEQLTYGTIRMVATNSKFTSTGTGFFFTFYNDLAKQVPINVIITNKHVVNGFQRIQLYFKKVKNNEPDNGPAYVVTIPNNSTTVIQHPNNDIDLVAIPTAWIYAELAKKNIGVYYIAADESRIATDSALKVDLKAIEDVWMIGYPMGLWDADNNLPIVRKGITATPPYVNYNGKREFMIDIAAFHGSSGSPVEYYRDLYVDKNYVPKIGTKLYLLGILYAGAEYAANGKLIKVNPKPIPTKDSTKITTNIPINLGYVIKASELLEFKKLLPR
ncbi:serine protease [Mucilaginibacter gossypii]|uniref:S1 family peptidase n=1 Tax=Mucilaginibacter gossypii TaxID=551996 RepID=UPI001671AB2D|nr:MULTISPECIES: serine protease [Mucilaginibacter]QTE34581.1 serine protease [Mucilaginibacter gossypii]